MDLWVRHELTVNLTNLSETLLRSALASSGKGSRKESSAYPQFSDASLGSERQTIRNRNIR